MKTNRFIIAFAAMSVCMSLGAQTSFDAGKLYDEELNGTARYVGMGGAMGALGSDPSVISHNPAGIGTYRQSDINLSLGFFGASVNTDPLVTDAAPGNAFGRTYYSHNTKSELGIALDNFSAIFSGSDSGDNYVNFGFSYRKLLNIDRDLDYCDSFLDGDNYEAWREYRDHQRNKVNSFDFNISCNLSDKLYLGWTMGILSTDTWSEGYFWDYYGEGMHPDYPKGFDVTAADKMNQSDGSGWNMAFGMIIRPFPALRLGASVKTPTYFKQKLEYTDYLYAFEGRSFLNADGNADPINRSVEYKFSSPWVLDLSAGITFGKTAIGAEYEKHFTQRSALSIGNTRMNDQGAFDYKDFSVLKLGLEQNISNLSLRLGYNYRESMFNDTSYPYLGDSEFNRGSTDDEGNYVPGRMDFQIDRPGKTQYLTGGIGYCSAPDRDGTQFYVDLAYVHGVKSSSLNVNELIDDVLYVDYNYKTDKVVFTIGWNF